MLFSFRVQTILIILIANEVYIVIFTLYLQAAVDILSFFLIYLLEEQFLKLQSGYPFSRMAKDNEIVSLAIFSGELTDLRSLVAVCIITGSGFFSKSGLA